VFALIGWAFGELVVEPLRRRRLRALVARPVFQEVPMRRVKVEMVMTVEQGKAPEAIVRRMKVAALAEGAAEILGVTLRERTAPAKAVRT
jgi:hypothetical protein